MLTLRELPHLHQLASMLPGHSSSSFFFPGREHFFKLRCVQEGYLIHQHQHGMLASRPLGRTKQHPVTLLQRLIGHGPPNRAGERLATWFTGQTRAACVSA